MNDIKVSFLGDIALVGSYNHLYKTGINPFDDVQAELASADLVIGNLECLAEGSEGENLLKRPRLKTRLSTLNYLKYLNLGVVALAHNHVYDNLEDGFVKTTDFLKKNYIRYLGAGRDIAQARKPIIFSLNGISIGLLNYVTHDTNPNLPSDATVSLNWFEINHVVEDINAIRNKVDHVILLLHWGGRAEGGYFPDFDQPKIARKLIDAGADLIVGHHPHTLQPFENYREKYIFYSLGNFCFADYYTDGRLKKLDRKKRTKSIILTVTFTRKNYRVEFVPIINENLYIKQHDQVIATYKRRNLYFKLLKKSKIIWVAYYWNLKYVEPVLLYLRDDRSFKSKIKSLNLKKLIRFVTR